MNSLQRYSINRMLHDAYGILHVLLFIALTVGLSWLILLGR